MRRRLSITLALSLLGMLALAFAGCAGGGTGGGLPSPQAGTRYERLLAAELPRSLPIPVEGVTAAKLVDTWGDGREGGRGHQGIDIFARRGTPVRSTTAGVIDARALRGLGGRIVDVVGPGGYRHYYAHLEDWAAPKEGDWVAPGEVIGYVGDSGNAAWKGTHLHYGIYSLGGEATDPYPYLTGKPGR
jgi:murein DD-endopeptidase MepM/ murein hydrolase activator NlpD